MGQIHGVPSDEMAWNRLWRRASFLSDDRNSRAKRGIAEDSFLLISAHSRSMAVVLNDEAQSKPHETTDLGRTAWSPAQQCSRLIHPTAARFTKSGQSADQPPPIDCLAGC